ncbi:MAG: GpE family phage tail protein [Planctomycetota bacterium]
MPGNWRQLIGGLAYLFHFQPSELDEMDTDEMLWWDERAREINEAIQAGNKS